jgi:hypothetical protein
MHTAIRAKEPHFEVQDTNYEQNATLTAVKMSTPIFYAATLSNLYVDTCVSEENTASIFRM